MASVWATPEVPPKTMDIAGRSRRCLVMGIVNVTPDSFSDAGECFSGESAIKRIEKFASEGADIIDIGGESTRPGATPVEWQEEWRRIAPVIKEACSKGIPISVDTRHPETAANAISQGAKIINCVEAAAVPAMLDIAAHANNEIELVVPYACREICREAGLYDRVYIDPMIGFGTTREEDLELLRATPQLAREGRVLIGASRKRIAVMIGGGNCGTTTGTDIAISLWAASNGASAVRVHDVKLVAQALRSWEVLRN